jgi:hypothetical protein
MRIKSRALRLVILSCVILIGLFIIGNFSIGQTATDSSLGFMLVKPALAAGDTSFLEQEAGIAAYVNVGQSIDLSKAKTVYRTIERETTTYIVGSVALPDYQTNDDIHAFIQKDGWIVAYYAKDEPRGKIVDWLHYSVTSMKGTRLSLGMSNICNMLGLSVSNLKYYDFAFPLANKIMIIADQDSFKLTIPDGLAVYDRSYSFYSGIDMLNGKLTTELSSGISHTIRSYMSCGYLSGCSYGILIDSKTICSTSAGSKANSAIVLVYRE